MQISDFNQLLLSNNLFVGCDASLLDEAPFDNKNIFHLKAGEDLFSSHGSACIGILLSGRCAIYSAEPSKKVLMRFVFPGEAVGVASLFSTTPPTTDITACNDSGAHFLILSRDDIDSLFSTRFGDRIRNNTLSFLSNRVSFLNSRIACITGGSAERKLAIFLNSAMDATLSLEFDIGMSMKSLANALNIGRASLYRAFDSLEKEKVLIRNGTSVTVINREHLLEIFK